MTARFNVNGWMSNAKLQGLSCQSQTVEFVGGSAGKVSTERTRRSVPLLVLSKVGHRNGVASGVRADQCARQVVVRDRRGIDPDAERSFGCCRRVDDNQHTLLPVLEFTRKHPTRFEAEPQSFPKSPVTGS